MEAAIGDLEVPGEGERFTLRQEVWTLARGVRPGRLAMGGRQVGRRAQARSTAAGWPPFIDGSRKGSPELPHA